MTPPTRRFLLVGLTGGIATGKSTVSDTFRRLGGLVIDADQLAREVVEPAEPALAAVVREFGDVLAPDGTLDRKKLAAIVFADPGRRRRLEGILHPAIRARFDDARARAERYRAHCAALRGKSAPASFDVVLDEAKRFSDEFAKTHEVLVPDIERRKHPRSRSGREEWS